MYARIDAGQIVEVGEPTHYPIFHAGRWWDCRDDAERAAYIADAGWVEVVAVPRPADTATETSVYSVTLVGGVPTETWTPRPWTEAELARRTAAANAAALSDVPTMEARLARLAAYKTDPDLLAVLANANNTALSTAALNRALKVMIRREERLSAAVAALTRLIDPALLASVTDTTDASPSG